MQQPRVKQASQSLVPRYKINIGLKGLSEDSLSDYLKIKLLQYIHVHVLYIEAYYLYG